MLRARKWLSAASVAAPALLLAFFAFRAGGFFPDDHALVALALLAVLLVRVTLTPHPLAGVSPALVVAVGAMALLAVWALLSGLWSHAPGRALLEYDRALLYMLAVAVLGTLPRGAGDLAWVARGLAVVIVAVCAAGLTTRLAPDVWRVAPSAATDRLSYPLTYWNALGVVGGIGAVLLVHLTCSLREPRAVRVLAAAAAPVVVATVYFTFSRGGIAAGLVGIAAYLVVGRPTGWLTGLVPSVGASVAVIVVALGADTLASAGFDSPAGIAEGHDLALVVGVAALAAGGLRALCLPLDGRLAGWSARRRAWPLQRLVAGWAAIASAAALAFVVAGGPGFVERQADRFVEGTRTTEVDQRARLLNPGNNGRLDHWRVALERFRAAPVRGAGAGTYETAWDEGREIRLNVLDAHSLYVEMLGEMGVVGLALLAVALATLLWGFLRLARGPARGPAAALFAAGLAWALHAGIDWDWEMPATAAWLFAAGGLALAAPAGAPRLRPPGRVPRIVIALGCLVVAVIPVQVIRSQAALEDAARAFAARDCGTAIDRSLVSLRAISGRAQPYEIIGFCDGRLGYGDLAVRNLELAVDRDPRAWQGWYGLAIVRGATGRDPRPAARRARELNPLEPLTQRAVDAFSRGRRAAWERRARRLPLPGLRLSS